MSAINSPFRYAGGKFYARKLILEHIPQHSNYIEVFAGGGSIFFAKDKVANNQLNDIDKELINTYQHIQKKPEELILFLTQSYHSRNKKLKELIGVYDRVKMIPASKEIHYYFKNEFTGRCGFDPAALPCFPGRCARTAEYPRDLLSCPGG